MKLRHNPYNGKEIFDLLAEIFNKIFRVNPEERISIEELQKYKIFSPPKSLASIST